MFKASENATQDTGLSYLDTPYLGACNLVDIKIEEINGTPNCLKFVFGNLTSPAWDGEVPGNGTTHEHVEWAPTDQDDADKKQNKVDRITYIAARIIPEDEALAIEAPNWTAYINAVKQKLEQAGYSSKQLYMKAIGDVYKGKPRVKFPGYRNFLSDQEDLTWGAKEKASNREYMETLQTPASGATDEGIVDNAEQAAF